MRRDLVQIYDIFHNTLTDKGLVVTKNCGPKMVPVFTSGITDVYARNNPNPVFRESHYDLSITNAFQQSIAWGWKRIFLSVQENYDYKFRRTIMKVLIGEDR